MKENRLRPQKLITIVSLNPSSFVTFYVNFTDGEKDKEDLFVGKWGLEEVGNVHMDIYRYLSNRLKVKNAL